MKTLVIISHPDILESGSQQFLLNAVPSEGVTIHHLESTYPSGKIDVQKEQELLDAHDRIIFQFPFYWYSSPAPLKQWQDDVLTNGYAHGKADGRLAGKEFGLVFMLGVHEREYQAGGRELFSISELTRPFQAMAHKTGMTYLRPLTVYQFAYMTDEEKMDLYIRYQQKLTNENSESLASRERWVSEQLRQLNTNDLEPGAEDILNHAADLMETNRTTIDELQVVLDQMW
ncbi:putative NAD(P)H oxidoreductase YrkL [Lentibacillus sp. JNUCC-1]|uniref:NAD(P)H-dependent oxidoreductase n=1 Tax=Lentibacillus sp. JNUCC-1 TaxID=2654513 RepID=UPI0012E96F04|nr:NAD(P)H-dependent oxidoreductase [Lentibacillus sp. JNUCC-1]MUV36401.1 putative NAD(P)H oxidoreductase YrkL [Lentibacillus sp. JNUCC-1]